MNSRKLFPFLAIIACHAACGDEQSIDESQSNLKTQIVLRPGTYNGLNRVVRDTCGLNAVGDTDAVYAVWMGDGVSGYQCSDHGTAWVCDQYSYFSECQITGTETLLIEPVTTTSFRSTQIMRFESATCNIDCEVELKADMVRD